MSIVEEVLDSYNVDGIHLDIACYPALDSGYCNASIERFNQELSRTGIPAKDDDQWCNWRRARVSGLVRAAYQAIGRLKPAVKLSAAVLANKRDAYEERFQDWEGWLRAGTIDFVVPMVFPSDNQVFANAATASLGSANGRAVYIGQAGWKMSAQKVVEQVTAAREAGAGGVVVYSYHYCSQPRPGDSTASMDALKAGLFAQSDTIPVLPWK